MTTLEMRLLTEIRDILRRIETALPGVAAAGPAAPPTEGRRRVGHPWNHRAFYRLPERARARVIQGFKKRESTTAVAAALRELGQTIAVPSLNRYREYWTATEGSVEATPRPRR